MCLAIAKPARAVIPIENLQSGYEGNPHGCGFCYSENGKLTIVKGLFKFEEFYKQYKEKEHLPMLVHFRFSTHGKPNHLNCHPFSILDGQYALIHNGVIKIHCSIPELSDTGNFSKLVMEPMLNYGIEADKPAFRYLVEECIGGGNKVCLMRADGRIVIYNEEAGSSEDAVDAEGNNIVVTLPDSSEENVRVWYSHGGYKFRRRKTNKQNHEDEYEGIFNCGQGEEAEPITGFENRAKLDLPPATDGIIEGFKAGIKTVTPTSKFSESSYDANDHRTPGRYPPSKPSNIPNNITEITTGPIFDSKTELEISYLQENMNVTRAEAIHVLQLETKDTISYVDP